MMAARTPKVLEVVIAGQRAGQLTQDSHGQLRFVYSESYQRLDEATPLSLSMRPTRREHGHKAVDPWLRGLLPDSQAVLARWGSRFRVSANSPFALLTYVGEDVAGAVQFVRPDRVDEAVFGGGLEAVDADYIAERLAVLRNDRAAWNDENSAGQFSLAGAQSKVALYHRPEGDQWAIPTGRRATTHILKPALPDLADQDVNEHLCLVAARNLGLDAARSEITHFGDERAIVLERYDRQMIGDEVIRIHQEDFCQALGLPPDAKYERDDDGNRGRGPGVVEMIELMRSVQSVVESRVSAEHYVKALAYNWLIYAPDGHAKNYSILLAGSEAIPSPLYDISSVLPYPRAGAKRFELRTMTSAMSVNRRYQNNLVLGEDWVALAASLRLDPEQVLAWVTELAARVPDAFADAAHANADVVGKLAVVTRLIDGVADTAARLRPHLVS